MDDHSYIKVFRSMLDWEWWDDKNVTRLFLTILLSVNWQEKKWHGITISKGSMFTSLESLSKKSGLTVQQTRTALTKLISTNNLTSQSTKNGRLITVENWEKFQGSTEEATNKPTNKRTAKQQTSNKRSTTTKESKERKNIYITPTIEEVREYISANNLVIDADYFFDYYEDAKWKDKGGDSVRNWKLKARSWHNREVKNGNNARAGNTVRSRIPETDGRGQRETEVHRHKPLPLAADVFGTERSEDDA